MGIDPMKDCKFVRLAHELGLGCGDPRDIEIVGDVDAAKENWHFDGPFKNMTFASKQPAPHLLGPAEEARRVVAEDVARPWAYVASVTYHDIFWYPVYGRRTSSRARERLGPLFANWGKVAATTSAASPTSARRTRSSFGWA